MSYELIVDMSLDVDRELLKKSGAHFIPMEYVLGEDTHRCTGLESDEMMHEYYDKLRQKVKTQTSQITPYHYEAAFKPYLEEGKSILYICLSSGLSKTYESALLAVEMLKDEFENVNIEVIDSLGGTGGMGLLLESAYENKCAGMSLEENAAWLREHAGLINYWFKVEDLMYLMRGGRVSAATAIMGTALNIKPILTIRPDGTLDTVAKKRGNKQAMSYMLEQLERNFDPSISKTVYICCADCIPDAEKLKASILEKKPEATVRITMLSPIIGAHTGPDMLAIIYYGTTRN